MIKFVWILQIFSFALHILQVIYQQPNPAVYYEYILPKDPITDNHSDAYSYSSVLPLGKYFQ